jgi:hypothetical protein
MKPYTVFGIAFIILTEQMPVKEETMLKDTDSGNFGDRE